jgi:GntR family transcriptional regulator of vanillate catabolism
MTDISLTNRIREMILAEELPPGARVTEVGLATRLGVSRTPIRSILPTLAAEGLIEPIGKRGFAVRAFSETECLEALELRAYLEAYAGRLLAKNGISPADLAMLEACLEEGDQLFSKGHLDREDEQQYGAMNEKFHRVIVDACNVHLVRTILDRLNRVPFVAPSVIVFDQIGLRTAYEQLMRAHGFHHAIVEAIKTRDGERVEVLFREHANQQRLSMFSRRAQQHASQPKPGPAIRRRKRVAA